MKTFPSTVAAEARSIPFIAMILLLAAACDEDGTSIEDPGPCDTTFDILAHLRVDEVRYPDPMIAGSQFHLRGESFVAEPTCVELDILLEPDSDSSLGSTLTLDATNVGANELIATLSTENASALMSERAFSGDLVVHYRSIDDGREFTTRQEVSFDVTDVLTPVIESVEQEEAYLNDPIQLEGTGFLTETEGSTQILVEGTYTVTHSGEEISVSERIPAQLLESSSRTRAAFLWSPRIGGPWPGSFVGTATPENIHDSEEITSGAPIDISIEQQETTLYGLTEESLSLGQITGIEGRGFIGGEEGTTVVRLEGEFTPHGGSPQTETIDIVAEWVSGTLLHYVLTPAAAEDHLESIDFGAGRGQFTGSATPILAIGGDQVEGVGADITLTIAPIQQVVWVRFLVGFSDSLEDYGLGAVEELVRGKIIDRMQDIYCPESRPEECVGVTFRTEEPTDFFHGGYAILDVGGPDPNNMGLFGYDNTGTKDVYNLRLSDHIGGENALGDVDGYAYGGVFADSFFYWSDHPPFSDRPEAAPDPDPRFDAIFDPIRDQEVIAGEYPEGATGTRHEQIEQAINFFSSVVADTGAHELAHSLGLAQPFGEEDDIHNPEPSDGCLMDSGRERPIEERGRLDGNEGSRFCGENLEYLQQILPIE